MRLLVLALVCSACLLRTLQAAGTAVNAGRLDAPGFSPRHHRQLFAVPANWCSCCSEASCSNTYCWWEEPGRDSAGQTTNCACSCCGPCNKNMLYADGRGMYCDTYGAGFGMRCCRRCCRCRLLPGQAKQTLPPPPFVAGLVTDNCDTECKRLCARVYDCPATCTNSGTGVACPDGFHCCTPGDADPCCDGTICEVGSLCMQLQGSFTCRGSEC